VPALLLLPPLPLPLLLRAHTHACLLTRVCVPQFACLALKNHAE